MLQRDFSCFLTEQQSSNSNFDLRLLDAYRSRIVRVLPYGSTIVYESNLDFVLILKYEQKTIERLSKTNGRITSWLFGRMAFVTSVIID
jgi:hypothetical protein